MQRDIQIVAVMASYKILLFIEGFLYKLGINKISLFAKWGVIIGGV